MNIESEKSSPQIHRFSTLLSGKAFLAPHSLLTTKASTDSFAFIASYDMWNALNETLVTNIFTSEKYDLFTTFACKLAFTNKVHRMNICRRQINLKFMGLEWKFGSDLADLRSDQIQRIWSCYLVLTRPSIIVGWEDCFLWANYQITKMQM